jgi:hypothetical protein
VIEDCGMSVFHISHIWETSNNLRFPYEVEGGRRGPGYVSHGCAWIELKALNRGIVRGL